MFLISFSLIFVPFALADTEPARAMQVAYKQTTGSGDNKEILAVGADDKVRIYGFAIYNGTSSTITLHLEGSAGTGNILHKSTIGSGEGYVQDYQPNYIEGNPGQDIDLDTTVSSTIWVVVWYELIPGP